MANEIFTRIQLKYDSYANWEAVKNTFTPLKGELCIVDPGTKLNDASTTPCLLKVGNGTSLWKDLPWISATAADVYGWAKCKTVELVDGVITFHNGDKTKPVHTIDLNEFVNGKIEDVTGDLTGLNTAAKTTLVAAINEVRQAVEVGGTGSVVTIAKLATPTTGSAATYQLYQGSDESGNPIPVGDKIEIPVSTKVEASDKNGYIKVDDEDVRVFDDVFKADGKTVVAAGGIAAGSEVNGKTFQQILYNMMYPYQRPTISATAAPKNGGTFEKGNAQTITSVTATVTKKTEEIAKVELYNGSTLVATKNGDDTISSSSTALVKNGGKVVFEGLNREVSANGGQYKVKVYDTVNGTAEANTGSFTFVYPYYIGICYEGDTINEALVLGLPNSGENGADGNKDSGAKKIQGEADIKDYEFSYTKGSMVFAFPKSYGKLSSIKDPSNFEIIGSFTVHEVNITGLDGTAQPYYVYVSGVASNKDFKVDFYK